MSQPHFCWFSAKFAFGDREHFWWFRALSIVKIGKIVLKFPLQNVSSKFEK